MPKKVTKKNVKQNVQTKGFIQKVQNFSKANNKPYTLQEIKELCKTFDEEATKNNGRYMIRARNEYRDVFTLRSYNGIYYDEDDSYYTARGYEKDKFEKFNVFQIIYIKPA